MSERNYKREIYPIELIRTGILLLDVENRRPIRGYFPYRASRALVLYCMQKMPGGYLPLNREYKPLGISFYEDYVKYEDYPFLLIPENMVDPAMLKNDSFTFDDSCYPSDTKSKKRYRKIINELFLNKIDFKRHSEYEFEEELGRK